ncbi:MAG: sodium:solute symporter family protein [Candidatus Kryptoniota bacterium]
MNFLDYSIVFAFLIIMFGIGSIFYKWIGSSDDFYVAGRNLTPFVLAAVLAATNINLYSFIGQAGVAYKYGIPIIWQTWTGNMAMVLSGLFIIPIYRRLRIRTIPEFLQIRYNRGVRTLVAVIWVVRLAFYLGVILYTAITAAQIVTGVHSFTVLALVLSLVVVIYTMLGGMWSVTFTDVIQFVLMLGGALVLLPLAMSFVGWWPGLVAKLPENSLTLVQQSGKYSWKFIIAIFLLGIEWASIDQGLLQRAFGAENTRTVAKGLVLAGIITTPFALLWNLPGLAARVIFPHLTNPDMAVPLLLSNLIPHIILGIIVVGLLSSQLSATSGNLNGIATVFASDIYENVLNKKATQKHVILVARIITVLAGIGMVLFAYWVPLLGGAVNAYLTIIAIMDMPLFVITVIYGLLWKRANWQGAIAGYLAGALAGVICQYFYKMDFNLTTFISAATALVVTPIVSLLTPDENNETIHHIWRAKHVSDEEIKANNVFNIIPKSFAGKMSLLVLFSGLLIFFVGVFLGSTGAQIASVVSVAGMILYFIGGLVRTYTN